MGVVDHDNQMAVGRKYSSLVIQRGRLPRRETLFRVFVARYQSISVRDLGPSGAEPKVLDFRHVKWRIPLSSFFPLGPFEHPREISHKFPAGLVSH